MNRLRLTFTGILMVLGAIVSLSFQEQIVKQTPDFRVEVVAENLRVPWSIVFLPDGRMLFTERPGRVRLLEKGKLQEKPVLILDRVENAKKMGLLGMALHPEFSRNKWVYLAYNYKQEEQAMLRVVRYQFAANQLIKPRTIIENIPANQNHSGCRLLFGLDGKLYLTTGDADVPRKAQELNALNGKILRLNDDGSIPADNHFVTQTGARPEVWSYGHRNPQGIDFQPGTGYLFDTEHGPNGGDEVNRVVKGANYGWPVVHHQDVRPGMERSLLEFTPSIGPGSAIFYEGKAFPLFKGDLLVACLRGEAILRVQLKEDQVLQHEFLLQKQYGRIREVAVGPEGYIYFSTSQHDPPEGQPKPGYDKIFRLVPVNVSNREVAAGAGAITDDNTKEKVTSAENQLSGAAQTFSQVCANCHGIDLKGTKEGGNLIDGIWKFGGGERAIFSSIKKGHPEVGMPAWEGALTDTQMEVLVDYISQQEKDQAKE